MLEDTFFVEENKTENQHFQDICCNVDNEKGILLQHVCIYHMMTSCDPSAYLQSIAEMLLYLLLPEDDFQNKSLRFILRVKSLKTRTKFYFIMCLGSDGRECVTATSQSTE